MIYTRHSDAYDASRAERSRMPYRLPPALVRASLVMTAIVEAERRGLLDGVLSR